MSLHSRRAFLTALGTAAVASTAGCAGGIPGEGWPATADGTTDPLPGERDGWPQYRRDAGHSGFVPAQRFDDPSEDWRVETPGGLASPAVVGDSVFVHGISGSDDGDEGPTVRSLAAVDGTERWRRRLPSLGSGYSGATPIVYRGSVYVGNVGESGLYAIDARDGSRRWAYETGSSVNEAAVGVDGRVFATTGSELFAFDERGNRQWTYQNGDDRATFAAPALAGERLVHTTTVVDSVVGFDPAVNGPVSEWLYEDGDGFHEVVAAGETAYVTGDEHLHAIASGPGERRWRAPVAASATPSTDGDRVYLTTESDTLIALAAGDGERLWEAMLADEEGVSLRTPPLVTERSVVVTTERTQGDAGIATYGVDRRSGEIRWRVEHDARVANGAVAVGGRLYVAMYDAGTETGTLLALRG